MSPSKTATNDEYFDQLATATEEAAGSGWLDSDYGGQLAVDVYETDHSIVVRAAIAGVRAEDIDISVNNDMVTIKGVRQIEEEVLPGNFLYQECYWGGFSRSIILPVEVRADQVRASLKNGILRVVLPRKEEPRIAPIEVVDEDEA